MKPFCEIVVSNILPPIRALITKELMHTYGFSQMEIAKIFGISQPAVSQYSKELRGFMVKPLQSNKKIMSMIKRISTEIASGKMKPVEMHEKFCDICKKIRKEKIVCKMHDKIYPNTSCDFCFK